MYYGVQYKEYNPLYCFLKHALSKALCWITVKVTESCLMNDEWEKITHAT